MDVALGLRPHPGWAAAVLVGPGPEVLARERVVLADRPPPVRPFHAAAGLPTAAAAELVEDATAAAYELAAAALARLVAGRRVTGVAVVAGTGSVRTDLPVERALAAHGTLHAAEAELYRDALADAADRLGLPVILVAPRETPGLGRRLLGCDAEELPARLTELGRPLGRPWTRDHKDALVAALAVLEPWAPSPIAGRRRRAPPGEARAGLRAPAAPAAAPSEPSPGRRPGARRRSGPGRGR